MELGLIFLTGLFLSLHCVGMCGGFVALVAAAPSITTINAGGAAAIQTAQFRRIVLPQQLVFNAGRIGSYTLLGAVAGALGSFTTLISSTGKAQAGLMIGAGIVMIATGLTLAGLLRHWSAFKITSAKPNPWLARCFEHV
ncbi:MAG: sulfite exporter TauE/SafE family protein, partial [Candidatus Binataceae bacterium]